GVHGAVVEHLAQVLDRLRGLARAGLGQLDRLFQSLGVGIADVGDLDVLARREVADVVAAHAAGADDANDDAPRRGPRRPVARGRRPRPHPRRTEEGPAPRGFHGLFSSLIKGMSEAGVPACDRALLSAWSSGMQRKTRVPPSIVDLWVGRP